MTTWQKVLLAVLIGAVAGAVQGGWGSSRGLKGMIAGAITIGLIPLLLNLVAKRSRKQ
jgi:hypothetical protein